MQSDKKKKKLNYKHQHVSAGRAATYILHQHIFTKTWPEDTTTRREIKENETAKKKKIIIESNSDRDTPEGLERDTNRKQNKTKVNATTEFILRFMWWVARRRTRRRRAFISGTRQECVEGEKDMKT